MIILSKIERKYVRKKSNDLGPTRTGASLSYNQNLINSVRTMGILGGELCSYDILEMRKLNSAFAAKRIGRNSNMFNWPEYQGYDEWL